MKRFFLLPLCFFILGNITHAADFTPAEASKRIATAVAAFEPLAQSGVRQIKIKPARTVKEAMLAVAIKEDYAANEDEMSWAGTSAEAWEADSTNFGESSMKEAFQYVTSVDKEYEDSLSASDKAKLLKQVQKAKDAFKLLLKTGVQFGVVPMGAVQCGVTFAALAIIDPYTGVVYIFSKEGSGC